MWTDLATRGGYVPPDADSPLVSSEPKNTDTHGAVAILLGGAMLAAAAIRRRDERRAFAARVALAEGRPSAPATEPSALPSFGPMTTRTGEVPEPYMTVEDAEEQRRYLLPPATERYGL